MVWLTGWLLFTRQFLRYGSTHGKTLAQIYSNIGIEPPSYLPQLDDECSENNSDDNSGSRQFPELNLQEPKTLIKAPKSPLRSVASSAKEVLSPRSAKISVRSSLPRALFTDPIVVPIGEGLSRISPG